MRDLLTRCKPFFLPLAIVHDAHGPSHDLHFDVLDVLQWVCCALCFSIHFIIFDCFIRWLAAFHSFSLRLAQEILSRASSAKMLNWVHTFDVKSDISMRMTIFGHIPNNCNAMACGIKHKEKIYHCSQRNNPNNRSIIITFGLIHRYALHIYILFTFFDRIDITDLLCVSVLLCPSSFPKTNTEFVQLKWIQSFIMRRIKINVRRWRQWQKRTLPFYSQRVDLSINSILFHHHHHQQ